MIENRQNTHYVSPMCLIYAAQNEGILCQSLSTGNTESVDELQNLFNVN